MDTFIKLFHSVDFQNRESLNDDMENSEEYKVVYDLLDGDQCGPWNVAYHECAGLVNELFANKERSVDQFVTKILEVLRNNTYNSGYSACIKHFGRNILDYIALDIIIPLIIFIRDKISVEPCSLRALITDADVDGKIYNKINEPMKLLPDIIKKVFCVNRDNYSGHYQISTHYPKLLYAIIKKINVSNCIDTKSAKSFIMNKKFLETCIYEIKAEEGDDTSISKIIEEYYVLERFFNLHARIDIITSIINSRTKGTTRDKLIEFANSVQYMPSVFNRIQFYHHIKENIISNHNEIEELIGNINILTKTLIPLIQKAMYLYLVNRDIKDQDRESFYYGMIKEIYESEIYKKYCKIDIPEKINCYYPSEREMGKYSDLVKAWDMTKIYSGS